MTLGKAYASGLAAIFGFLAIIGAALLFLLIVAAVWPPLLLIGFPLAIWATCRCVYALWSGLR